jgi:cell division protein FtsI/penicillin-binding protein 2
MMKQFKPVLWIASGAAVLAVTATAVMLSPASGKASRGLAQLSKHIMPSIEKSEIAALLGTHRFTSKELASGDFPVSDRGRQISLHLTLDKDLQERIENLYDRYDPAYAAFVAIDPDTGKILAMVDHSSDGHEGNLALQATFPAASVFKVVTSAAALGEGKIPPNTRFPVNGRYGTLYKSNLRNTVNRWTRFISIEEAFAKSVNTVFAKIAMNRVGPTVMQKYADSFGFNQTVDFEMPMEMGSAVIPTDDEFGLAESGSGYTRRQTLNPIQGAMIAASVINGGSMPAPYIVESAADLEGNHLYEAEVKKSLFRPLDKETAKSLAMIMEHTVTQGTARKEFRDYNHHPLLSKLFIGAKTGSLSGTAPAGKYDWFVGFAQSSANPRQKIAFASMIVNRKYWKVKSAHIAREAIIQHFKNLPGKDI